MNFPAGATASNVRFLSRSDQGGRPDGVQVIVHKGHAFIGHMFSDGFSVVDVRDPLKPKTVAFVAAPKNTRSHHLQIHGDVLLAVNGPNIWAMQQYASQQDYYAKSLIDFGADRATFRGRSARFRYLKAGESARNRLPEYAGLRRSSDLVGWRPLRLCLGAFRWLHRPHFGGHRCVGPDKAATGRPLVAARHEPRRRRNAASLVRQAHGAASPDHAPAILGYAAWRDGGFTIHDLSDPAQPETDQPPQLLAALWRRRAHAAAAAGPQAARRSRDEATSANCANGLAYTWVIDVREPTNPVSIATLPTPDEEDFCAKGAKFGPHNLHENRPGSMQTEDLIFATYHNAGLAHLRHPRRFPAQSRSAISCRRRRKQLSINGRIPPKSFSPATSSSTPTASCI